MIQDEEDSLPSWHGEPLWLCAAEVVDGAQDSERTDNKPNPDVDGVKPGATKPDVVLIHDFAHRPETEYEQCAKPMQTDRELGVGIARWASGRRWTLGWR